MSADSLHKDILEGFLQQYKKKRRFVHYGYQELGLYIAHKLGEWDKRSFYIRLARDEDRTLLQQALMYAGDSGPGKKARDFLWRLTTLKQNKTYRAFVGLFFEDVTSILDIQEKVKSSCVNIDGFKSTDKDKLHLTLYFWSKLQGGDYPKIVRAVRKLRQKYNTPISVEFKDIDIVMEQYVWLFKTNAITYRMYHSFPKMFPVTSKIAKDILKRKQGFNPHITLGRFKKEIQTTNRCKFNDIKAQLPVMFKMSPFLAISKLTSKGPIYKIHKDV